MSPDTRERRPRPLQDAASDTNSPDSAAKPVVGGDGTSLGGRVTIDAAELQRLVRQGDRALRAARHEGLHDLDVDRLADLVVPLRIELRRSRARTAVVEALAAIQAVTM